MFHDLSPVVVTAIEHADRLMEEQPEPPLRIAPKGTQPRAHLQTLRLRVDRKHGIAPRLALIIAVAGQQISIWPILTARPTSPEASLGRGLHARRHRKGQILPRIGRHWIEDELRRDVDAMEKLLRDLGGWLRRIGGAQRS